MAFTGEREYIQRHLDYLWELMVELDEEAITALPERAADIQYEYDALKKEYDDYFQRLGELPPRW